MRTRLYLIGYNPESQKRYRKASLGTGPAVHTESTQGVQHDSCPTDRSLATDRGRRQHHRREKWLPYPDPRMAHKQAQDALK